MPARCAPRGAHASPAPPERAPRALTQRTWSAPSELRGTTITRTLCRSSRYLRQLAPESREAHESVQLGWDSPFFSDTRRRPAISASRSARLIFAGHPLPGKGGREREQVCFRPDPAPATIRGPGRRKVTGAPCVGGRPLGARSVAHRALTGRTPCSFGTAVTLPDGPRRRRDSPPASRLFGTSARRAGRTTETRTSSVRLWDARSSSP